MRAAWPHQECVESALSKGIVDPRERTLALKDAVRNLIGAIRWSPGPDNDLDWSYQDNLDAAALLAEEVLK